MDIAAEFMKQNFREIKKMQKRPLNQSELKEINKWSRLSLFFLNNMNCIFLNKIFFGINCL